MSPHVDTPREFAERGRIVLPDLHSRLMRAADRRGLTAADTWRLLNNLGIECSRPYIYKLFDGNAVEPRRPMIAGLAHVLRVDVRWFYTTLDEEDARAELLLDSFDLDRPA